MKVLAQENIRVTFFAVCLHSLQNSLTKPIVIFRGENAAYKFIKAILEEYEYCNKK